MRLLLVILVVLLGNYQRVVSQSSQPADTLSKYFQFDNPAPLSCLFTYFPPFFIEHGLELKDFIRSKSFQEIRKFYGDARAVDAIYVRSMQLTNNNTAMALLLSTIACFDHHIVGLKVPVFQLFFPLSNESSEEFTSRVNNLPTKLYTDSPQGRQGDRDKLQHFFGSAFLTFISESRGTAERIGDFVEEGEDAVIIDGKLDERDRRANLQGQDFGLGLLEDNHRMPSQFLRFELASEKATPEPERVGFDVPVCVGVW